MPVQDTRKIVLETPLGKDVLLLQSMSVHEDLGRPFEIRISALSEDYNLALNSLLGESISVMFETFGAEPRYFNALVSRFSQMTSGEGFARYEIIAKPWLWFLTRNTDCRIFQEMTVPEIIKQVFRDRGFSDFDDQLKGDYRTWEYCVQYRESDFNFVSRLMEQEGIYYYFKHTQKLHTLVLSDSYSSHETITNYDDIPYYPKVDQQRRERDHINEWNVAQQVQPGKYALNEYDFEAPTSDLLNQAETSRDHAHANYEVYDYPGEYVENADGSQYAQIRNEELHAQYERAECGGNARGIASGALFTLSNHPREDQNKEYLVVSATHNVVSDNYASGEDTAVDPYGNAFVIMDAKQPFRAPRSTPKPMVQGPQTAVVVGKSGEEIWCDEYGRVKVQFHWDRYGANDENSSCWVRVAQVWAGTKWGAMHIPRMGQEVIVDFLEGDPDQPIITGRVYNADNMPPYDLPGNQTQSGIKSRSTKGGGADNFNEIRFEDKKGEEQMYIHAEKNQDTVVENNQTLTVGFEDADPGDRTVSVNNDHTETIGHDKAITVGNDRTEDIGHDRSLTVGNNKSESVGVDKSIDVGSNHSENIGSNQTINVGSNLTETVGINYAETVGVAMELTIGAAFTETVGAIKAQTIGAAKNIEIGTSKSEDVGSNKTVSVGGNLSETISGGHNEAVTKAYSLSAKTVSITADDSISIKTGKASITMKKDGTINISGKDITIKGTGKINTKASKDIIMKGKKILQN